VIEAMLGRDRARATLRVSLGEDSTRAELDVFLVGVARVLPRLRKASSVP